MSVSRSQSDGGFTLVEALVSALVFGLLATGSVVMLTTSVETRGRLSGADDDLRRLEIARALLSSDMAQLVPPTPGGGPGDWFKGQGAGSFPIVGSFLFEAPAIPISWRHRRPRS